MSWRVKIGRGLVVALVCHAVIGAPPMLAQSGVADPFEDEQLPVDEPLPAPRTAADGFEPLIDPALIGDDPLDDDPFPRDTRDDGFSDSRGRVRPEPTPNTLNHGAAESTPRFVPGTGTGTGTGSPGAVRPDAGSIDEQGTEILPNEVVRERYEDGSIKIERGVSQDENQNYINHGNWTMRDPQGRVVAEGSYRFGRREGKWRRLYQADESPLFALPPFNQFDGPYLSEAEFKHGELDGHWTIHAGNGTLISDWNFVAGRRDGESRWYYHTRELMRSIEYQAGRLEGRLVEFDINGNTLTDVTYEQGRRLEETLEKYPNGDPKLEGMVLRKMLSVKQPDDWWEAKLASYTSDGKDEKHGDWKSWYPSGQQKFQGKYQFDEPAGEFSWWHENGQKSLSGFYEQGGKQGQWTWWHASGVKSIQGQYQSGSPVGRWIWWHEDGKVAQRIDFSAGAGLSGPPADADETQSIILQQPRN